MHNVASTDQIRAYFPALQRREAGYPVAYFDGPGGTQVPHPVVDAATDYLYHHNANTHWNYPTSSETDASLEHARRVFAGFLHSAPEEIVFGANMTTLTFHLARALGRRLSAGDEIIVTELDHHANIAPWQALEAERGVRVRWARMIPETGQLDREHLEGLVNARTKVVAVGAAANALGTVNDVRAVADWAHAVGALVFVDGVHYAPHALPDMQAFDCDFFACSPYKFYGPHLGVLFGRRELLDSLEFAELEPASHVAPERAETGTLNHEGIVGAAAGVEWLGSLAEGSALRTRLATTYRVLEQRGGELFAAMWEGLTAVPGVRLYGPPPNAPRTPTLALTVDGTPSSRVTRQLAERGVFTSHGDFYALTVVERLGLLPEGLVRAGCACYTTAEEVDRLIGGIRALADGGA
jgi:cysteine desulfurase family protein (TIGR01976 family)